MGHLKNFLIKENLKASELSYKGYDIDNFKRDVIPHNNLLKESLKSEDE